MNLIEKLGLEKCKAIVDGLKAKNIQLTHALVNANAEKSKWAKDYWQQVERCAECGAMLMTDPDSLGFKCYQKEKQNEELTKQLRALTSQLNNMEACYIGVKKELEDQQKRVDAVKAIMNEYYTGSFDESAEMAGLISLALRGEHD